MPSSRLVDRLNDIIKNIAAILSYTHGMDEEAIIANRMAFDATERCLTRISEAASKLGPLAEQLMPDQPRRDIRGLGNWLRHGYPHIQEEAVWKTITEDLVPLRAACDFAIARISRGVGRI